MTYEDLKAILSQHQTIGWDVDATLIRGKNSHLFQQYVVDHPDKNHHIVTFRTGSLLRRLEIDLSVNKIMPGFNIGLFTGVHGISEAHFEKGFSKTQCVINYNDNYENVLLIPPARFQALYKISQEQYAKDHRECFSFKPHTCKAKGMTILVDDMVADQRKYCIENNVLLLDSINGHIVNGLLKP